MKYYRTLLNSTYALALGALLAVGLNGCTADELVDEPGTASELGDVTVIASLGQEMGTRTGHEENDPGNPTQGIKVSWTTGDAIKIMGMTADGTFFEPIFTFAGMDGASGIFKGKTEPLSVSIYTIVYPARITIGPNYYLLLDMTGQTQWGNDNMAHLGAYDAMQANPTDWRSFSFADNEKGSCHINALMTFDLKGIPADLGRLQSITLGCTSTDPVFYSNIQNFDNTYLVPTLELKLTGFETPAASSTVDIKAYLMMAPCAIPAGERLIITVKGEKNSYTFTSAAMAEEKLYKRGERYTASIDASGWEKVFSGVDYTGKEPIEILKGSGTSAGDPYVIATPGELGWLVNMSRDKTLGKYFRLDSDIRINMATTGKRWRPIGNNGGFAGTFDGNGHTIWGVMDNGGQTTPIGFFSTLDGATIKNLTVNAYIKGTSWAGAIVGQDKSDGAASYIINCTNKSYMEADGQAVGGIMGWSNNTYIMGCVNEGTIKTTNQADNRFNNYGGIVGILNNGAVVACYNKGSISSPPAYAGGIAGSFTAGTITACYHTGDISGSGTYYAIADVQYSNQLNYTISYCQYMGWNDPYNNGSSTAGVATQCADLDKLNTAGVLNLNTGITEWNNAHPTQPCSFKFVAGTGGAGPRLVPAVIPN